MVLDVSSFSAVPLSNFLLTPHILYDIIRWVELKCVTLSSGVQSSHRNKTRRAYQKIDNRATRLRPIYPPSGPRNKEGKGTGRIWGHLSMPGNGLGTQQTLFHVFLQHLCEEGIITSISEMRKPRTSVDRIQMYVFLYANNLSEC